MNTTSNEQEVIPSSSDELSMEILPEDTPLIFQWLPKSYGASIPNNQKHPYLQRIVNWAEREPQRKIYLVVNEAGFKLGQIKKLREDLKPASNIQVVDYLQEVSKKAGFEHFKIYNRANPEPHKLSEILTCMYHDSQDRTFHVTKKLGFANILDAMRLEMLLNIEKITSTKEAIYFDFDISLKDNKQIGPVNMSGDILFAPKGSSNVVIQNSTTDIDQMSSSTVIPENSIIAVNNKSQDFI